mmetsp:Transcript_91053/g.221004  ORF Transcript_91053/g.221004 Transcript_91053/m.221004 type:complete len:242 (-) Transcript_91053:1061-1786(-)
MLAAAMSCCTTMSSVIRAGRSSCGAASGAPVAWIRRPSLTGPAGSVRRRPPRTASALRCSISNFCCARQTAGSKSSARTPRAPTRHVAAGASCVSGFASASHCCRMHARTWHQSITEPLKQRIFAEISAIFARRVPRRPPRRPAACTWPGGRPEAAAATIGHAMQAFTCSCISPGVGKRMDSRDSWMAWLREAIAVLGSCGCTLCSAERTVRASLRNSSRFRSSRVNGSGVPSARSTRSFQ